jgi:hypothetical protein
VKYLAAIWLVLTIVIGYELTGMAFTRGFEQGYVEGKQRTEMSEQDVFLQCTAWWFDGNEPRAMQAINQYCDRRRK